MATPPPPTPERWQARAAFAMAFALCFLGLTLLGNAWTFPHRYAPVATDFDTGFMGTLASGDVTPLAIVWGNASDEMFHGTPLTVQELTFYSERFNAVDLRIFAALVRPRPVTGRIPALVVVHGYGGAHQRPVGSARGAATAGRRAVAGAAPGPRGSAPHPAPAPPGPRTAD